ncbi:MAG TPA: spore coat protein CotJB [Candidatus Onthocola gallistercoris]|uniref:Spore coat protein CotJB n=1 Tax=Candidatus Onthocola gallistercoris TaxID=2840876 RepID=A0A9D1KWK1_9FIRM|nr:spore coat protein CotJB [Candidatus Onthocola gallistercoris]
MRNMCQFSKEQLMLIIYQHSFAVDDIVLYLDSHPDDGQALEYFREHNHIRNQALKEYARRFGPLTIETANDTASQSWQWIQTKWPWEGGAC